MSYSSSMRITKTLFLILLAAVIPISLHAWDPKTEKRIKEFKEEFKGIYIVDGTDIYIQRVIEFPNTSKEELTQMVKDYASRRLERLGVNASNSNVKYHRDAYIMIEQSPAFHISRWLNSSERYTYRIEIKDNRIRVTISLNEVQWGNFKVRTSEFYPFAKVIKGEIHMKKFSEYAMSILDSIKDDMQDEVLDDSW